MAYSKKKDREKKKVTQLDRTRASRHQSTQFIWCRLPWYYKSLRIAWERQIRAKTHRARSDNRETTFSDAMSKYELFQCISLFWLLCHCDWGPCNIFPKRKHDSDTWNTSISHFLVLLTNGVNSRAIRHRSAYFFDLQLPYYYVSYFKVW